MDRNSLNHRCYLQGLEQDGMCVDGGLGRGVLGEGEQRSGEYFPAPSLEVVRLISREGGAQWQLNLGFFILKRRLDGGGGVGEGVFGNAVTWRRACSVSLS